MELFYFSLYLVVILAFIQIVRISLKKSQRVAVKVRRKLEKWESQ